jgi:hypothetical protein
MKQRLSQLRCWLVLFSLAASLQITPGYYDPAAQHWINRDPLGEVGIEALSTMQASLFGGGPNVFIFVSNGPTIWWDAFGLQDGQYDTGRCKARCHDWADALAAQGGFNAAKALQNCFEGCDRDPKYVPGSPLPPLPTLKPTLPKEPLWPIIKECAKAAWDWWHTKKTS